MGNFYVNYTIRSGDQSQAIKALSGRRSYVASPKNGALVVFDEQSDAQDLVTILDLGKKLSRSLGAPVLAVLNHDDDVLWYGLFENGECTDEYDSSPDYLGPGHEPKPPSGGDAQRLCAAFGAQKVEEIQQILRKTSDGEIGYASAKDRHVDLVKALELPHSTVGVGYTDIAQGELPAGLAQSDIIKS